MRLRVLPELSETRLAEVRRPDLQGFVDSLLAEGLNPATIEVTFLPLRAIYRRALARGGIAVNPCDGLQLPAKRGRRERFASPDEAEKLIAALPVSERAIWATAMYAGLRRGELMVPRREDVDLASGVIHVKRGWDDKEGEIELKSHAGRRRVPIASALRDHLLDHLATLPMGNTLFDFEPRKLTTAADNAWEAAGLERITLHECRHTFASLMIAAGVNAKALQTFMGHANISITLDRYGHLMSDSETEAAGLLDAYLTAQRERAEEKARSAPNKRNGPEMLEVRGRPRGPREASRQEESPRFTSGCRESSRRAGAVAGKCPFRALPASSPQTSD